MCKFRLLSAWTITFFIDFHICNDIIRIVKISLCVNLINISMDVYNRLCSNLSETTITELKRSIKKFRWSNDVIPQSFHVYLFNEEFCSEKTLHKYIEAHDLDPKAECMLFDKYSKDQPKVIINYLNLWYPSATLQIKVIESGIRDIISALCKKKLFDKTELRVVKMNNPDLLYRVLSCARRLNYSEAINVLLDQMNPEMVKIFASFHCKHTLSCEQEFNFLNSGNDDLYNQAIKWGGNKIQDANFVKLLNSENMEILTRYLAHQLCIKQDILLVKSRNQKLINMYLEKFPLSKDAQIELVKLDDRDTLRYHFDKYGISRETMAYYAHMRMFKDYIGVE